MHAKVTPPDLGGGGMFAFTILRKVALRVDTKQKRNDTKLFGKLRMLLVGLGEKSQSKFINIKLIRGLHSGYAPPTLLRAEGRELNILSYESPHPSLDVQDLTLSAVV